MLFKLRKDFSEYLDGDLRPLSNVLTKLTRYLKTFDETELMSLALMKMMCQKYIITSGKKLQIKSSGKI